MKIEPVDILEVTNDNGVVNQFRRNDIVGVVTLDDKCYIGKIKFVDTQSLEIDASKEYESAIISIKYKDIESIKLMNSKKGI